LRLCGALAVLPSSPLSPSPGAQVLHLDEWSLIATDSALTCIARKTYDRIEVKAAELMEGLAGQMKVSREAQRPIRQSCPKSYLLSSMPRSRARRMAVSQSPSMNNSAHN